jgi:hypothetical protein
MSQYESSNGIYEILLYGFKDPFSTSLSVLCNFLSLLTTFSKIHEKVIYKRVIDVLNSNIIFVEQLWFRKALSSDRALYILKDQILCALNNKTQVGKLFCELAKAFDCVNHDMLLPKLNFYGIQGKVAQWFKSYSNGRTFPNSNYNMYPNWRHCKTWSSSKFSVWSPDCSHISMIYPPPPPPPTQRNQFGVRICTPSWWYWYCYLIFWKWLLSNLKKWSFWWLQQIV